MIFTEFVLPNGARRRFHLDVGAAEDLATRLTNDHAVTYEIEVLSNGVVSMEALRPGEDAPETLASELCRGPLASPDVPETALKMLAKVAKELIPC